VIIAPGDATDPCLWEMSLRDAFGSIELKNPAAQRRISHLRSVPVANLTLIEAVSDDKVARRTAKDIAADKDDYFILILVLSGRLQITQFGKDYPLDRDTFGLFHLGSPSHYCHHEHTHVIDLKIPASTLRSYIRDPHRYVGIARSASSGIGRVVADLFKSLMGQATCMPDWALHSCAGQMMGVVATALECAAHDPNAHYSSRSKLFSRAQAYIEINAGDPLLNASMVADSVGISLRYLQNVFQEQDRSIGDVIKDCRLQRCYEALLSGKNAQDLVKEVAYRGGFRSASHFSTAFKRRYGISPNELRRSLAAGRARPA
jgi:AraC family transcriptional activator of tynA and feaB